VIIKVLAALRRPIPAGVTTLAQRVTLRIKARKLFPGLAETGGLCVLVEEELEGAAEEAALRDHRALGERPELRGHLGRAEESDLGLVGLARHGLGELECTSTGSHSGVVYSGV
jgi:hypothetical protein